MLAPPPRAQSPSLLASRLFEQIGCATCHVPALKTGRSDEADFLLHDMGELGDGIEQGDATGKEMRTAPLWGLHVVTRFLHDGRATSIADAIRAHDGQGRRARDAFLGLPADKQGKVLAFLGSL